MSPSLLLTDVAAAAALLPQSKLKLGLAEGRAGLADVLPSFAAAAARLAPPLATSAAATDAALRGAGRTFRRARAAAARRASGAPGTRSRSPGTISKEAAIASCYFERQLALAVLAVALPAVLASAADCVALFRALPSDVVREVRLYANLPVGDAGVTALCGTFERAAEVRAQVVKDRVVARKVAAGRGAHEAGVRNNAASRKSDAKKAELCDLTRLQVVHLMALRTRVVDAMDAYAREATAALEAFDVPTVAG